MEFCSILKDHPDVLRQSQIYPYISIKYDIAQIPNTFDGRDIWWMYIQSPTKERHSSSWALVARDVLNDRLCLFTAAQLYIFLDYIEILKCIEKEPMKKLENVPSTNSIDNSNSTQGYSIYDAWEFIYANGLCQWNCESRKYLVEKGINPPDEVNYNDKKDYYKDQCYNKEKCIREYNNKPIARRIFLNNSIFNIEGKDMNERILNIKYQIAKWGPVAGGFLVFDNFVNNYDGTTIYEKGEGKILGGHYVSIVGWGENYWICRNSFGAEWGLMGYFYMKMGIEECRLEYNISSVGPQLPNYDIYQRTKPIKNGVMYGTGNLVRVDDMKEINPALYNIRKALDVNYELFYTQKTIEMIKQNKLYGSLSPLITYPELLPDLNTFWIKDLSYYNYVNLAGKNFYEDYRKNKKRSNIYLYLLLFIGFIVFMVGYRKNR